MADKGGFKNRTIQGLGWSVIGQFGDQAVSFMLSVVLARLLSPREFGLLSMVVVFTGFASIFQNVGLGAALVQYQGVTERHLSSVFWVNVGIGLVLAALFFFLAPLIGSFYDESLLIPITSILAL